MKQKDVAWILNLLIFLAATCLAATLWFAVYKPQYQPYTSVAIAIVGPILGVVVSSRISFLKEMTKEKNDIRKIHLSELDRSCVRQIESNVTKLIEFFGFYGSNPLPLPEAVDENSRYFEKGLLNFSIFTGIDEGWGKTLYDDLKSHSITRQIPIDIHEFGKEVSLKYKMYAENYEKLYKQLQSDHPKISKQDLDIILLIALGYDNEEFKHDWKNTWTPDGQAIKKDSQLREFVYKEGSRYGETEEANEIKEVHKWVEKQRELIIGQANTIRRVPNVWDTCKIIKEQIDNM